jgi:hypothetical protein
MQMADMDNSGLIDSERVTELGTHCPETMPVSPNSGVNTVSTHGLTDPVKTASVVDVSNSPIEDTAVLEFFETSVAYFGEAEHSFRLMPNGHFG